MITRTVTGDPGIVKLFFLGLAKVLGVAFGNHLGIMQVLSVILVALLCVEGIDFCHQT